MFELHDSVVVRRPVLNSVQFENFIGNGFSLDKCEEYAASSGLDISLVSSSLAERLVSEGGGRNGENHLSLLKYLNRASYRSTPYGTMSSFSFVKLGSPGCDEGRTLHVEIDGRFAAEILKYLVSQKDLPEEVLCSISNFAYVDGSRLQLTEKTLFDKRRGYSFSSVGVDSIMSFVLGIFEKPRFLSINNVCNQLVEKFDVSKQGAIDFVYKLLEEQVLSLVDVFPHLTGDKTRTSYFCEVLEGVKCQFVKSILLDLLSLKRTTQESEISSYLDSIDENAKRIGVDIPRSNYLYLITEDRRVGDSGVLDLRSILQKAVSIHTKSVSKFKPSSAELANQIRQEFGDRCVPLLDIFHPEHGLTQYRKTLDSKVGKIFSGGKGNEKLELDEKDLYLLELVSRKSRAGVLDISLIDFNKGGEEELYYLPPSVSCKIVLNNISGEIVPSISSFQSHPSVQSFARFSPFNSRLKDDLHKFIDRQNTEHDRVIFADLSHDPDDRASNVTSRAVLHKYDISLGGEVATGLTSSVDLSSLLVFVEDDYIYLVDREKGKLVIPRLCNAHGYYNAYTLPIYRFLASIESQFYAGVGFSWGGVGSVLDELPRVMCDGVILAPRTWYLRKSLLKELQEECSLKAAGNIPRFFENHNLPMKFKLMSFDRFLVIDMTNDSLVEIFAREAAKAKELKLEEYLDGVGVEGGAYSEEVCCLATNRNPNFYKTVLSDSSVDAIVARAGRVDVSKAIFHPSEQQCCFRLYSDNYSLDLILRSELFQYLNERMGNTLYTRYRDENGDHLRLRVFLRDGVENSLECFSGCLTEAGVGKLFHRLDLSSYYPENYRYGGSEVTTLVEQLYCLCSKRAQQDVSKYESEDERVIACASFLEKVLSSVYDTSQRNKIYAEFCNSYNSELKVDRNVRKRSGNYVSDLLKSSHFEAYLDECDDVLEIFKEILSKLETQEAESRVRFIYGFIHMQVNRTFVMHQRNFDFLVSDLLRRHTGKLKAIEGK
ncbi:MAG: lantibiotic dehydratase [Cellvibrionaceae bacterium]|nr:lantibiotic dehydratase [Cellvibrionaceae bacterium]